MIKLDGRVLREMGLLEADNDTLTLPVLIATWLFHEESRHAYWFESGSATMEEFLYEVKKACNNELPFKRIRSQIDAGTGETVLSYRHGDEKVEHRFADNGYGDDLDQERVACVQQLVEQFTSWRLFIQNTDQFEIACVPKKAAIEG